jgi:hypothetical protein
MDQECLRLSLIAIALLILADAGFGLLLFAQFKTLSFVRAPFFTCYLLLMFVYLPLWNPNDKRMLFLWEPVLLSLKICIVAEVFWLATEYLSIRERRRILLLLGVAGIFGSCLIAGYYASEPNAIRFYKASRQHVNLALAIICLFGNIFWWERAMRRPRRHGLFVTLYLVSLTAVGFRQPANQAEWLEGLIVTMTATLVCIALWAKWGLLVAPSKRAQLERPNVVAQVVNTSVKT